MNNLPKAKEMMSVMVEAIRELGGTATVRQIEESVAKKLKLSTELLAIPHDKSRSEYQYRLAWTRSYAKKAGLVASHKRNHWSLPVS